MGATLSTVLRVCHLASCIPLAVLVVITSADVIARYALAASVPDTIEISSLMLGLLISLALASATGDQVRFDVLLNMLPPRAQVVVEIFTASLSTIVFLLMGWEAVKRSAQSKAVGEYVGSMEILVWPAKSVFALGCLLTAATLLATVIFNLRRLFARQS